MYGRTEKRIGGFEWSNQESVGGANNGVGGLSMIGADELESGLVALVCEKGE